MSQTQIIGLSFQFNSKFKNHSFRLKSGATYEGEWMNGMKDGFGIQIWPDRAKYEGEW
jgi:hypothetical protein